MALSPWVMKEMFSYNFNFNQSNSVVAIVFRSAIHFCYLRLEFSKNKFFRACSDPTFISTNSAGVYAWLILIGCMDRWIRMLQYNRLLLIILSSNFNSTYRVSLANHRSQDAIGLVKLFLQLSDLHLFALMASMVLFSSSTVTPSTIQRWRLTLILLGAGPWWFLACHSHKQHPINQKLLMYTINT